MLQTRFKVSRLYAMHIRLAYCVTRLSWWYTPPSKHHPWKFPHGWLSFGFAFGATPKPTHFRGPYSQDDMPNPESDPGLPVWCLNNSDTTRRACWKPAPFTSNERPGQQCNKSKPLSRKRSKKLSLPSQAIPGKLPGPRNGRLSGTSKPAI